MVGGSPKVSSKVYKEESYDDIEEDRQPTLHEPPIFCQLILYRLHQNTVTVII